MEVGGHELSTSSDCVIPGCTEPAKWSRGPYAGKCETHRLTPRAGQPAPQPVRSSPTGKVAQLDSLKALAKKADKARASAEAATRKALSLKRDADTADQAYRDALREAVAA